MKKFLVIFLCVLSITNLFSQRNSRAKVVGAWESWRPPINPGLKAEEGDTHLGKAQYYSLDNQYSDIIFFAFLTLDPTPSSESPRNEYWDGNSLYYTSLAPNIDIISLMRGDDPNQNWLKARIDAIIEYGKIANKKFIWGVGGWSDLTMTLRDDQVDAFVNKCVELLEIAGDGIDFDWEHLSEDPARTQQQRAVVGKVLYRLRKALAKKGMQNKIISYSTRLNAFWDLNNLPKNVIDSKSDVGEGIDVAKSIELDSNDTATLDSVVDYVNIMSYDMKADTVFNTTGYYLGKSVFSLDNYITIIDSFGEYISDNHRIAVGFEPNINGQANQGAWGGYQNDKMIIDYCLQNEYSIMFWAINHVDVFPTQYEDIFRSDPSLGLASQRLAAYFQGEGGLSKNKGKVSKPKKYM